MKWLRGILHAPRILPGELSSEVAAPRPLREAGARQPVARETVVVGVVDAEQVIRQHGRDAIAALGAEAGRIVEALVGAADRQVGFTPAVVAGAETRDLCCCLPAVEARQRFAERLFGSSS